MDENFDPRINARDYLADHLNDVEIEHWEEQEEWGESLVDWLRELPAADPICTHLGVLLSPFIEDDERLEGILYFAGHTSDYLDRGKRGGDFRDYLEELLKGLYWDYERWTTHIEEVGADAARWTFGGPPKVSFDSADEYDGMAFAEWKKAVKEGQMAEDV